MSESMWQQWEGLRRKQTIDITAEMKDNFYWISFLIKIIQDGYLLMKKEKFIQKTELKKNILSPEKSKNQELFGKCGFQAAGSQMLTIKALGKGNSTWKQKCPKPVFFR